MTCHQEYAGNNKSEGDIILVCVRVVRYDQLASSLNEKHSTHTPKQWRGRGGVLHRDHYNTRRGSTLSKVTANTQHPGWGEHHYTRTHTRTTHWVTEVAKTSSTFEGQHITDGVQMTGHGGAATTATASLQRLGGGGMVGGTCPLVTSVRPASFQVSDCMNNWHRTG